MGFLHENKKRTGHRDLDNYTKTPVLTRYIIGDETCIHDFGDNGISYLSCCNFEFVSVNYIYDSIVVIKQNRYVQRRHDKREGEGYVISGCIRRLRSGRRRPLYKIFW